MTITVGQTLDKYKLVERVGQGGMSVVYRGIDQTLDREVAIKVLHEHLADHPEAKQRFEREARAVAKLRHDNILEIYAFSGQSSDDSYIVTEFIEGQTLACFLEAHPLQRSEVGAMIVQQVCRALSHAHGAGILHRDVKPENIMIRQDGIVKLTDFGIAQMIDHKRVTMTGQLLGSPAYMSPEHVEGKTLGVRTDIFATGIVLYQTITNELPFSGENAHQVLRKVAECKFPDPQRVNPSISNRLRKLVLRAMQKDPDRRFANATEMDNALGEFLRDSGIEDSQKELREFFKNPHSYEMTLKDRLVRGLAARGSELRKTDPLESLDCFHRVLTLDPKNEEVQKQLLQISRSQSTRKMLLAVLAIVGLASATLWFLNRPSPKALAANLDAADASVDVDVDAALLVSLPSDALPLADAAVKQIIDAKPRVVRRRADAARTVPSTLSLQIFPKGSLIRVNGGAWQRVVASTTTLTLPPGVHQIEAKNDCCQPAKRPVRIKPGEPKKENIRLGWLPATITPRCPFKATVQIDNRTVPLGRVFTLPITGALGERRSKVTFLSAEKGTNSQTIKLRYGQSKEVTCRFR